ncbi:MAG: YihY family inner membrane protein [Methylomonas sp.]|nr:YihY family inner membrane protein [Methylomonas sp.]PPD21221.1 MAG: ribonuclease BN [Methylomonas sp.]PPD27671.1 MAG: ribonuclease BN [Methylomonas sp.]PPD39657.1 MAG: ribonuclease BN [Methylomonas sp.]PPD51689.1 MAG: ribonuclease BN [Methylomonas sp.]
MTCPTICQTIAYQCQLWFRVLLREYGEGGLQFRAMSLVYTTLLALAPMLAVGFSVLKAFGVHNQMQPILFELLEPLGDNAQEIGENLTAFVESIQVGVLGFVGFLLLFYTATSLLYQVEDCFNHVWRVTSKRSLYRRFSDYLTVILIGPVLVFSAMGIATTMNDAELVKRLVAMEPFGSLYYGFGLILPYLLAMAAFGFVIAFVPNTRVGWLPALLGGGISALAWKACGFLFSVFVANSAQYSAIYSGFAVILLSMIWLYLSWLILLLGGVIAFHIQFPRYLRYASRHPVLSIVQQECLALRLMYAIGRDHGRNCGFSTLPALADEVDIPWEWVDDVLARLAGAGLLLIFDSDPKTYVLADDTDTILLRDIIGAIRHAGQESTTALAPCDGLVRAFCSASENAWLTALGETSLRDMMQQGEASRHELATLPYGSSSRTGF